MDIPRNLVGVAHQRGPTFPIALYLVKQHLVASAEQEKSSGILISYVDKITRMYYDSGHFVIIWDGAIKTYLRFEECYAFSALNKERDST
jgi:hypothetical protein